MWTDEGVVTSIIEDFITYRIPTEEGQSGSPIIKVMNGEKYVIGIHIGTDPYLKKNMAIRLTDERRKMINSWVGESTGRLNLCKFRVNVGWQKIGDWGMKFLAEEKWSVRLTSLILCKWKLDLVGNNITATGMSFLTQGNWKNLRELDLST